MSRPTLQDMDTWLADMLYDEDDSTVKAIIKALRRLVAEAMRRAK